MEAILVLETKEILSGKSIGVPGLTCGELVFNTGITGYQEIITDPSYKNQIINFTYPHIGNVGINKYDFESDQVWTSGLIVKELSDYTSNWISECSLQDFLQQNKVIGIQNIDTRYLTRKIREKGYLNVAIMSGKIDKNLALQTLNNFQGLRDSYLINDTGTQTITKIKNKKAKYKVIVMDFGVKRSILNTLKNLDCEISLFPYHSSAKEIISYKPNGIILSNGPGDPKTCIQEIATIKTLIDSGIPILGICLGFQLLALALGGKTQKMPFGHHGINHPIQDHCTQEILITSQNHSFVVIEKSLPNTVIPTHYSLFDKTLQGFLHKKLPIFALQGHPEAGPGPSDAKKLFKTFITYMNIYKKSKLII